jgi:hypothetical protein
MAIHWKSILAVLAGATVISAHATHDRYSPYDNTYGYSYDRYGNAYDRQGNYVGRLNVPPRYYVDPLLDPNLSDVDRDRLTKRYQRSLETPAEREWRRNYEAAQSGELDGSTPHPLSKNYSPG